MKLSLMMRASGIGCGENCKCGQEFLSSLDHTQLALLSQMIRGGAEMRSEEIVGAAVEKARACT